jgi:hypothetical protein
MLSCLPSGLTADRTTAACCSVSEHADALPPHSNLARICQLDSQRRVDFEIVDVLSGHRKALEFKVLLRPALLIFDNHHSARITGSLDESNRVAAALGIGPAAN